ncbi:MAG: hypothetical protein NWE88_01975 [Candidatus Bathyarchaeota archaeon]|nr:hypothetical protein [Candidatus Bathyarchaeota archaeon]
MDKKMSSKHDSGFVGKEKVHSSAHLKEAESKASPPRTFWLQPWEEVRGTLHHVDLTEGTLQFEGFTVQIPLSLSADLASLNSLIDRKVSILRADSPSRIVVRSDGYRKASPLLSNFNPPHTGLKKIPGGTTSYEPRGKNAPKTSGLFK